MLGIGTAVVAGVFIYRGTVRMNLAAFFKFTGAALIVIAAGVLAYGVHDLQEAGIVPGLNTLAWDLQGYDVTSWYGAVVKGIFNLGPQMTVLEVITYVGYLVPTMFLFLRSPQPQPSTGEPTPVQADTASPSPQSAAVAH